nr:MAG: putative polyprotein [Picornavirales sp.]
MVRGVLEKFVYDDDTIEAWRSEGSTCFDDDSFVEMRQPGVASVQINKFIHKEDKHICAAIYRAEGYIFTRMPQEHVSIKYFMCFTDEAKKMLSDDIQMLQKSTHAIYRMLTNYYHPNPIPIDASEHVLETMYRYIPDFIYDYLPYPIFDGVRIPVSMICDDTVVQRQLLEIRAIYDVAPELDDEVELQAVMSCVDVSLEEPQGVLGTILDVVSTAFSAVKGLIDKGAKAITALLKPFLESLVNVAFSALIGDVYPLNAVAKVFQVINGVFQHIASTFGELFDLLSNETTPSSFMEAMSGGSTAKRITRWTLGGVSFALLSWIMYRLGIFTQSALLRTFGTIYDAVSGIYSSLIPNPVVRPQGPDSNPTINILGTVLTLCVALFSNMFRLDIVEKIKRFFIGLPAISRGVKDALASILALLPAGVARACALVSGDRGAELYSDMSSWILDSTAVITTGASIAALSNESFQDLVAKTLADGTVLKKRYCEYIVSGGSGDHKVAHPDFSTYQRNLEKLQNLVTKITSMNSTQCGRPEPVFLMVFGEAGTGKSMFVDFTKFIFKDIRGYNGLVHEHPQVYSKALTDPFYSGLQQDQFPITVFDEIWATADNPKESDRDMQRELLDLVSETPYMPPMPAVDPSLAGSKGTTFNSTLIIGAYNYPVPNTLTVDPRAFTRRMIYTYELVPPSFQNPGVYSATPGVVYFMLTEADKTLSASDLPNELSGLKPGFYSAPVGEDGKPKWAAAAFAHCDSDMYTEIWRFRHWGVSWVSSQMKLTPASETISCPELIKTIRGAIDLRVARFLNVLKKAGLRFRVDFNEYVTRVRNVLLTGQGATAEALKDLYSNVQTEIDDFVDANRQLLNDLMKPHVIEAEEFEDVENTNTPEITLDGAEAQFPSFKKKRVLVKTRKQVEMLEQSSVPVTAATLALVPNVPDDKLLPYEPSSPVVHRDTVQKEIEEKYPWLIDLVKNGVKIAGGVPMSFLQPDAEVVKAYPVMAYSAHRNILYNMLWRVHPNSAEYIAEKSKETGCVDKVSIIRSKYATDGKYKFLLVVCGDAITNSLELFQCNYTLSNIQRWAGYVDTCPIHYVNFWNDARNKVKVEDEHRFALNYVRDYIISDPSDRVYYPPVLAKSSLTMLHTAEYHQEGKWSYCRHCLRFFPPEVKPSPNVCLCTTENGPHDIVWFTDPKATDNLSALQAAVPSHDYMYFCAMAACLLWKTASNNWDGFAKIYQNQLSPKDGDSLKRMLEVMCPNTKYIRMIKEDTSADSDFDDDDTMKAYSDEADALDALRADYSNPLRAVDEAIETVSDLRSNKHSIGFWLCIGALVVGSLGAAVKLLFPSMSREEEDKFTAESALPRTMTRVPQTSQRPAQIRARTWNNRGKTGVPQGPVSDVTECMLSLDDGPAVRAFIPMGRFVFTYVHGIARYLDKGATTVTLHMNANRYNFPYDPSRIAVDIDHDLCCFSVPSNVMNEHRDVMRLFPREDQLVDGIGVSAYLRIDRRDYIATTNLTPNVHYNIPNVAADLSSFYHPFTFTYPIHTSTGDCGSLLRALDGPLAGKIIGFHVAAATGTTTATVGVSAPVYKELLLGLMQAIEPETHSRACDANPNRLVILKDLDVAVQGPDRNAFHDRLVNLEGPNLLGMEWVPREERVNVPVTNSYRRTAFADDERFQGKQPSIMQPVENGDPVFNAFSELATIETPDIDQKRLNKIADQQLSKLKTDLKFYGCARELTFEEAVAGIPSLLSSLRIQSSAGYPLVLRGSKGKSSFVEIMPNGEVRVQEEFYLRVTALVERLRKHDRTVFRDYPFYWLAFLKDELRPLKKIKNVATRMIYCNSLEWMVAARMMFGGLQVAFNNNAGRSIFSAGINVNSWDLQTIADYLGQVSLVRCIAGDYSGFDKHYHPAFQRAAYANMRELGRSCIRDFDAEAFDMFVEHELSPDVQFGDVRLRFAHSHFSGCFFTTAENCLVNELYFMYCFDKVYPNKVWAEETRFVALGDDHLVACSESIPEFNARSVCELMKEIGQVYTDENKMIPDYDYKPFEECGFLGSTPYLREGRYVGALRLETLYSNLSYITKETDFHALIETFLDLASVYPYEVFRKYLDDINSVWVLTNNTAFSDSYEARQVRQIRRTADSGAGFWKPEGPSDATKQKLSGQALDQPTPLFSCVKSPNLVWAIPQAPGDFTAMQGTVVHATETPSGDNADVHRAVGVHYASLTSPTQSPMFLTSFEWLSTDVVKSKKLSLTLPGDGIRQAMQQTVPFMYYRYWHGDVELTFQTNGNNFQAGALVAVLLPLKAAGSAETTFSNYLSGEHAILEPRQSTSCTLRVPYRYFTDVMATDGAMNKTDVLGTVNIYVLSPLISSSATSVTVTVLVSFPNSSFYGPVQQQAVPQGPDGVSVSDLVGLIPGSDVVTKPIRKLNKLLDTRFIAMDDTPIANGGVPTVHQFPGMSSTIGAKPVVKPTLHPGSFYRKTERIFSPDETKVSSLCAREGILKSFQWSTSDSAGHSLLQIPLNSICSDVPTAGNTAIDIPVNLAILNLFMYWHADLEFKLYVFKTPFHSGRLRVSLSLVNKPDASDELSLLQNQNMLFNQILDYSDAECCSFTVPFTAAREFLYTVSGSSTETTDKIGYLNVAVLNRLVTSTATVSTSVNCLLTVSLRNVRVAVPHPVPPVSFSPSVPYVRAQAQGPEPAETTVENPEPVPVPFGDPEERSESPVAPGTLDDASHFPYAVEDLMEIARRLEPVSLNRSAASSAVITLKDSGWTSTILFPTMGSMFYDLFMAYSGGIRVRVLSNALLYSYIPEVAQVTNPVPSTMLENASYKGDEMLTWTMSSGKVVTTLGVANHTATEMAYPLPDGRYYIDVEMPYEIPVNFYGPFNQIYYHTVVVEAYRPALILTALDKSLSGVAFVGAADDGLFGIFCPPTHCYYWWYCADATVGVGALD